MDIMKLLTRRERKELPTSEAISPHNLRAFELSPKVNRTTDARDPFLKKGEGNFQSPYINKINKKTYKTTIKLAGMGGKKSGQDVLDKLKGLYASKQWNTDMKRHFIQNSVTSSTEPDSSKLPEILLSSYRSK